MDIKSILKRNIFLYLISYIKKAEDWECLSYEIMNIESSFAVGHKLQLVYKKGMQFLAFKSTAKERVYKTPMYDKWFKKTKRMCRWMGYNLKGIIFFKGLYDESI